ncbi:F-box protein At3g07870-like isoform X2 [Apium graveolens]
MDLPADIVADILSRLPIMTIVHCRCVCKRWRHILSETYFVNLHLLRSPEGLVVHEMSGLGEPDIFKLGELDDQSDQHHIHHDPLMRFDLGLGFERGERCLQGSVNGLICLWNCYRGDATYICNPITREYIKLPDHKYIKKSYFIVTYGFGFVEASNQYKVICFAEGNFSSAKGSYKSRCGIYTLGTNKWRSLTHVPFLLCFPQNGILVSGNLHWLAYDEKDSTNDLVCTFDLEKELLQLTASAPQSGGIIAYRSLGKLQGCLCLCDNTDSKFVIWVMKNYGMKESWIKEIIIFDATASCLRGIFRPLKVWKDETTLMLFRDAYLCTYNPGNKIFQVLDIFQRGFFDTLDAMVYVPSFITLKSFVSEKVSVF